jgi:hypothetical protein
MNYPVWNLDIFGGGLLIALIAVFHVYISHFAVGGGLFLVLTELKGYREDNPSIIDYVRKHAKFFLLVTMVAGSMTGVGIWFTIALLNPGATSILIHNYVFGWATEWVFFLIEIISLFIYAYTFGRLDRKTHLIMGWIYFGAAWMSLFIINGIIDFMLTPGSWLENHNFWSGFFNPTFWPALFFRTFIALLIAGLFGLMTATRLKDKDLRHKLVRHCALYLLIPLVLLLASAYWYKAALPPELRTLIFQVMPEMKPFITGFIYLSPVLMAGGLLMAIRIPRCMSCTVAVILLIIGQLYMGCFEFMREGGRRPYIIRDHMYSNSILKKDLEMVRKQGVLKSAKWAREKRVTRDNMLESGKELYNLLCLSCHSIGGPLNDIKTMTINFTPWGLANMISAIDRFHPYMPPFPGTRLEQKALATYIAFGLNGRTDATGPVEIKSLAEIDIPTFDPQQDEYVLLSWTDMGMQAMTDASQSWMLLPPGINLHALLIKRGESPEIVTDDVRMDYAIDPAFADPAAKISFWDNAAGLFGREVNANTGLSGNPLTGAMQTGETGFHADLLPIVPYPETGGYMPYPSMTITATDTSTGKVLARTSAVVPTATEMGCNTCHGGLWRVDGRAGISTLTADNILTVHDRLSGTTLARQAAAGKPVLCQQCHSDTRFEQQGDGKQLNMSASIHGFHANFLSPQGADACTACHPAAEIGASRSFRGIHHSLDLKCTNCHGSLADHAISLLKAEQASGKAERATVLMEHLQPEMVAAAQEISPRKPWINEPDCLNCHEDFQPPEDDTTFNQWTENEEALFRNRADESGQLPCSACHNSAHALYPAVNPYGENLDNRQPLQYQKTPFPIGSNMGCMVCHTVEMEEEMHHSNMLREFRNQ